MDCKNKAAKSLMCAVAAGVIALTPLVYAQDASTTTTTTTTTGTMTATDTSTTMMSSTPVQASGTVLRYYTNRAGYVTAMDVQTANGVELVRFGPNMGQRLYSTYPVGGTANLWVQSNGMTRGGKPRYDLVGVGTDTPTTWMTPYTISTADVLDAEPYIVSGAKEVDVKGYLRNIITNDEGEVVGLVLGHASVSHKARTPRRRRHHDTSASATGTATTDTTAGGTATGTTTATTDTSSTMGTGSMDSGMMGGGMMNDMGTVLVRVPRNFRHISPGHAGSDRVAPLFRNAMVSVTGWPEAPVYGVLSRYANRVTATAIVVNGRAVGPLGFPLMTRGRSATLLNVDLMANSKSSDEMNAMTMGYNVYDPSGMDTGTGSMNGTGTAAGTTSTTGAGGSVTTGTATSPAPSP